MRIHFLLVAILVAFSSAVAYSQGVGINPTGASPNSSAALDVDFNNKGFLMPRLTSQQRDSIHNPANGLQIYNTATNCIQVYFPNAGWSNISCDCQSLPSSSFSYSPSNVVTGTGITFTPSQSGLVYSWSFQSANITSSNSSNPTVQWASHGLYIVSLTSTDGVCHTTTIDTIQVNCGTLPSSAFTYSPNPAPQNTPITFTPSQSGLSYSWVFQSANISSSNSSNPSVQWSNLGSYNVNLTVTDNNGCSSTTTNNVTVSCTGSQAFDSTGNNQTFQVPACANTITVKLWGAGGSGGNSCPYNFKGGGGGYSTATISVTPGETLTLIVGQCGVAGGTAPTYGGGGAGDGVRGSGGGRSSIIKGGTEIIIAGGGGAAGCSGNSSGVDLRGGAGGGTTGQDGSGANSGKGGTQSAGGAGTTCTNSNPGISHNGGSNYNGGGGGYYGGGSGGDCGPYSPGAGGGSSYLSPSLTNASTQAGSYDTPGNSSDSDRHGAGQGGNASNGGNGRIIISW